MAAEVNPTAISNLVPVKPASQSATARPAATAQASQAANQVASGKQNARGDTVSLSTRGLRASGANRPGSESGNPFAPTKAVRDVTEDHRLVVKFVDPESNEVVRQVPSEDHLRLKQAMSEIIEEQREDG
ncbi:flagellar protein FlaG [Nitrospina sp. 32_T5]|uniref:flagellar protein FlaG n=1 Tax=unclassified Nitrospina TaxID=2638683 RepID=UPI003F991268